MKFSYPFLKKLLPGIPPKEKVGELLNMHSFEVESIDGDTLDIKLPANLYSSTASHIGIAREIAAAARLPFKSPVKRVARVPAKKGLASIRVDDETGCLRYAARIFEIKAITQSDKAMMRDLADCGLQPINNVVDIMNYVMLETGQPLHAFDYDKIAKGIIVRRAKKGERIETLDGQKFDLDPNTLVIADAERPQAIAGIKGGQASGVSESTRRIIVEAANFEPVLIFKTSRRLKLLTDAAARFSHGMSPALVDWGLDRATELLVKAGAKLVDAAEVSSVKIAEAIFEFHYERYEEVVGESISPKAAEEYFKRLGFSIEKKKDKLVVRVPAWRTDIENEEGLIEEVARLRGYNGLPAAAPLMNIVPVDQGETIVFRERSRMILANLGLDEVYNSSFLGDADLSGLHFKGGDPVAVANPVADEKKYLRPGLLPLLIKNAKDNARYFDSIRIFEIGRVFQDTGVGGVKEKTSLGILLAARKNPRLILELKGILDEYFEGAGVADVSMMESGGTIRIESGTTALGTAGLVDIGKQWVAAYAELDFGKILDASEEEKEYVPLSRFPSVLRDISALVPRNARIGAIVGKITAASPRLIENVDLIDEYRDAKLGDRQSLTFRIIFQAEDRTLTDAEVNKEMEKIVTVLRDEFDANIR